MTPAQRPRHPPHMLTTAELTAYRHELEHAVAFFGQRTPSLPSAPTCKPGLRTCWPSRTPAPGSARDRPRPPDVSTLTTGELERTRRELAASLALTRPRSPARAPIQAYLAAIAARAGGFPGSRRLIPERHRG